MYIDNRHKLIWDFQGEIVEIYKSSNLINLAGLDRKFILNDRNILKWYFDTIGSIKNKSSDFDFNRCFEDLVFCSDEIIYFTALLILYRPYLQNPIKDGYQFGDKMVYPYTQTIEVSRFNMFVNTLYEKVYNYWDRIGDLIGAFIPNLNPKRIYFTTIIDHLDKNFKDSENYIWLKDFRESEFKELNNKRKNVVHYELIGTAFRWDHALDATDKEKISNLVNERNKLPEYFKTHNDLTKTGFEKTIQLLTEFSKEQK